MSLATRPERPALVLGIGNELLGDDGAGVATVRELGRLADRGEVELPAATRLVDGGTLGLDLLPLLGEARSCVIVDAMALGRPPGTVEIIDGEALRFLPSSVTALARGGLGDLLATARLAGALPDAVALVGIQPGAIDAGDELTGRVRAAIPAATRAVLEALRCLEGAGVGA
jgi:hydrogenase maturation protease